MICGTAATLRRSAAKEKRAIMKKGFLGSLATLLSGAGLALAQTPPPVPTAPVENAQSAPALPPASENGTSVAVAEAPPVDRRPWNPSLNQGSQWPYADLPHGWLSGLCPDLGEFWLSADYLLWAMKGGGLPTVVTPGPPDSRWIPGLLGTSVLIGKPGIPLESGGLV